MGLSTRRWRNVCHACKTSIASRSTTFAVVEVAFRKWRGKNQQNKWLGGTEAAQKSNVMFGIGTQRCSVHRALKSQVVVCHMPLTSTSDSEYRPARKQIRRQCFWHGNLLASIRDIGIQIEITNRHRISFSFAHLHHFCFARMARTASLIYIRCVLVLVAYTSVNRRLITCGEHVLIRCVRGTRLAVAMQSINGLDHILGDCQMPM